MKLLILAFISGLLVSCAGAHKFGQGFGRPFNQGDDNQAVNCTSQRFGTITQTSCR